MEVTSHDVSAMSSARRSDEFTTCRAAGPSARRAAPTLAITLSIALLVVAATGAMPQHSFAADAEQAPTATVAVDDSATEAAVETDNDAEAAAGEAELSAEERAAFSGNDAAGAEESLAIGSGDELAANNDLAASVGNAEQALADAEAPGDELWMVSARRAKIVDGEAVGLNYWRYSSGRWVKSSLEEFIAADPSIPTCFHVHGNRVSLCEANFGGWHYYTTLTAAGCRERGPLRWVIFTWPSDRLDCGPRKDVQIKAVRAECYGFYLAWLVDRMAPEAQVAMLGYSFGTRLIGASLHYLGGGTLRGRKLQELHVDNRHVRTVMLAAALDNNHFSPGHTMQLAPTQIDRLLLGLNPSDPALKWYALLYQITFRPRRGQQALGHTGVAGLNGSALNGRVEQRNMSGAVGREHDTHGFHYLTPWFVERMRTYVYFDDMTN